MVWSWLTGPWLTGGATVGTGITDDATALRDRSQPRTTGASPVSGYPPACGRARQYSVANAGRGARYPPFWSASVPSVSARCSVQNWPIGRTPVDAPAGRTVRVCSVRLVSFTHRPVAAICYEVEPVDGPARSTVQSELTANEQLPPGRRRSPAGRGARGPAARRVPRRHRNGRGAGAQDQAKRAAGRRRDRSPRRLPGPGAG